MNVTVLADALAPVLRELVDATAASLRDEIAALKKDLDHARAELAARPDVGALIDAAIAKEMAGRDLSVSETMATYERGLHTRMVEADKAVAKAIASLPSVPTAEEVAALIPAPAPGKDADPEVIAALVEKAAAPALEAAAAALSKVPTAEEVAALIPKPLDGKSVTAEELGPMVEEAAVRAVAALPVAKDGQDATPEQIATEVEKVLATWERPKDGESVTLEQLQPVVVDVVDKAIAARPPPKDGDDGVGLVDAFKDHEGALVLTMTNGTVRKFGKVDGEPGRDGLGFDDLEVIDDGMSFTLRLQRGDHVKEWTLAKPTLADAFKYGWKEGTEYTRGQIVMWAGQPWLAMADTKARPETNKDWAMLTKKARDGQDLRPIEAKTLPTLKLK